MRRIQDFNFTHKKVLVRVDFNVPLTQDGNVYNNKRILEALPTIQYLLEQDASIVLMSHLGRPEGKIVESLRLNPVAKELSLLLGQEVIKLNEVIGQEAEVMKKNLKPGCIVMLENIRFYPEEEKNDDVFGQKLAEGFDCYVNEGFSVSHRAHASLCAIQEYLPSFSGFALQKELDMLSINNFVGKTVALVGGAKLSTKIPIIENLVKRVDYVLIGGAMVFTFLKALGYYVGKSLVEDKQLEIARELLNTRKIVLATDLVVANSPNAEHVDIVKSDCIPDDQMGLDIGPETLELFKHYMNEAETIIWNGPMGYYENEKFLYGTLDIIRYLAATKARVIVGGGDSSGFVSKFGLEKKFFHVSTGGGASLQLLSGQDMPGISALEENEKRFPLVEKVIV
ncbi:phosphoglycerate kinase [Candidatus Woesearchaeota archaeon]|nr:phosphoglycerate kinase [Candidatus Woesearchaeota archaeon]